jgi:radical SAM-linked protein
MPVQRWRVTFSRGSDAPSLNQREQIAAWHAALEAVGLRDATASDPSRLVLAAPMPAGLTGDRELADVFLTERRTSAEIRARLGGRLPPGHRLVDVHDVWVGEPPLPGLVVAADYRVHLESSDPGGGLREAIAAFLAAEAITRLKGRSDRTTSGNLRPLVIDVRHVDPASLWMRLRFDPTIGTGRPEEVVEALAVLAGRPITTTRRHRERLWLKEEKPT